jgi:hypothetical protein
MCWAASAHHQEGQIVLYQIIPDDVLIQFGPPNEEHLLPETCRGINKYIKEECIKLVITQN